MHRIFLVRQKQHKTLKIIVNTDGEDWSFFLSFDGHLFGMHRPRANAFQLKRIDLFFSKELINIWGV